MSDTRFSHDSAIDAGIGRTLLGGLIVSSAVMALGLLLTVLSGTGASHMISLGALPAALARGTPPAVLDLGILLLFATPLAGVITALATFLYHRDAPFAWISALLLAILLAGFAVALH